ncbi:MAG TPA: hypothetical protein DEB31_11305 [Clostridiales bacterium]|nr:hypothetical protein [Clostridiales bacterium]
MYQVIFYKDRNGNEPVLEYIRELEKQRGKDARIKLNKLRDYVKALSVYGTQIGEPYIKHLDGDIWELRPISERVLFAAAVNGRYVLLHHFTKKTKKTPKMEIEKAKRELDDFRERSQKNE